MYGLPEQVRTTITMEIVFPDGIVRKYVTEINAWDRDADELAFMMKSLLMSGGFPEEYVNAALRGCVPSVDDDFDEDEWDTKMPEPGVNDWGDYDPVPIKTAPDGEPRVRMGTVDGKAVPYFEIKNDEDPCTNCDENCADTACLHDPEYETES